MGKDDFLNSLKVDVDYEIFTLKNKLEKEEIQVTDLNIEQIDKLQKIYDREIKEKLLKLKNLRKSA
jgi:hypothetical protein